MTDRRTAGQILAEVKQRYPLPEANSNWRQLKDDPEFFEIMMEAIQSGHSISDFARAVDIPSGRLTGWLSRLEGELQRRYELARHARASIMADRILSIMDEVEMGALPPQQGKFMTDNLMWMAARLDPKLWGNKVQIRAEVKTTVEMHLEAVRELATRIKAGDERPVIEGEVEPVMALESVGDRQVEEMEDLLS